MITITFLLINISLCSLAWGIELNLSYVPILMPSVDPKMPETYLCTSLRVDPTQKNFVVGFSPNASMSVVHHMLLYGCTAPGRTERVWNCGDVLIGNHHDFVSGRPCSGGSQFVYAWARNAPPLNLPEDVAFEIGKDTDIQFVVLQVHYADVESFKDGRKDNSGVVLHLTEKEQPKTAGVYLLGTSGQIPANATENMDAACVINEDKNFHPFAFRPHTHNLGRVVSGYQIRRDQNGTDQWTLIGKKDPSLPQTFYPVANNVTVMKGDILAARCTMVSNRTHITTIGSTGHHEMCNFYVMYWTQGSIRLEEKSCFSSGPPLYYWNKGSPALNNIPELEASTI